MKTKNNQDKLLEKVRLFKRMEEGKASAHEIVYLTFLRGMISKDQYEDFKEIEKLSG